MQDYNGHPSSRVKDLVDLVTSMLNERIDSEKLAKTLSTERAVRAIPNITTFSVPDSWKTTLSANYRKLADEASLPDKLRNVNDAESAVASWLQPVFGTNAQPLIWNPKTQSWATHC